MCENGGPNPGRAAGSQVWTVHAAGAAASASAQAARAAPGAQEAALTTVPRSFSEGQTGARLELLIKNPSVDQRGRSMRRCHWYWDSYVATGTTDSYSCSACSCADKMPPQKSITHRSSKLLPAYVFSSSSSHTQASKSRWLVGSSSSSMNGRMKSALKGEGDDGTGKREAPQLCSEPSG